MPKNLIYKFQAGMSKPATSFSSHDIASLTLNDDGNAESCDVTSGQSQADWSITFEQFLASVLNESALVNFFDQRVDIVAK